MADSLFGVAKYGAGVYNDTYSDDVTWRVVVDWDGNGDFDFRNEADRVTSISIQRGRNFFLRLNSRNEADGFQRVSPGKAVITLENYDGLYNPYNVNSPLYPNVDLLKEKRIKIIAVVGNSYYTVFTGFISDIKITFGATQTATIEAVDGLKYLSDQSASTIVHEGLRIDEAINAVLDKSAWTWGREIDRSYTVIPYWWGENRAYDEVCLLSEADLGYLFVKATGQVAHYSRNRTGKLAASISEEVVLKSFATSMPWEAIRNIVRVAANPIQKEANSIAWTLAERPLLAAGRSAEYWASFENATVNATCGAGDYSANSAADGSGTDLTADISVSVYGFGTSAKLTVTNNGGTDAYITLLQVKGDQLIKNKSFVESQVAPANRLLTLDIDWLQDVNIASDYASWLSSYLSQSRYIPTVTMEALPSVQFSADLFDTIELDMPTIDINDMTFVVGSIQHRWLKSNGKAVSTTLTLETNLSGATKGYWIFPTEIGISSKFGF